MALNGMHVCCVVAAGHAPYVHEIALTSLGGKCLWSETLTSPGVTSQSVPGTGANDIPLALSVVASTDCFVAIGPNPNAATGPRRFVPARQSYDAYVVKGDRVAWVPA